MSKEQLSTLAEVLDDYYNEDGMEKALIAVKIVEGYIPYLFEQAERVPMLEKQYDTRLGKFLKLDEENKCYREAIEQIKLQILLDALIEDHQKNIIEIIDGVLDGESNEST